MHGIGRLGRAYFSSILFLFQLHPCDPARECVSEQSGVHGDAEVVSDDINCSLLTIADVRFVLCNTQPYGIAIAELLFTT
jgi:hypothetical protein